MITKESFRELRVRKEALLLRLQMLEISSLDCGHDPLQLSQLQVELRRMAAEIIEGPDAEISSGGNPATYEGDPGAYSFVNLGLEATPDSEEVPVAPSQPPRPYLMVGNWIVKPAPERSDHFWGAPSWFCPSSRAVASRPGD